MATSNNLTLLLILASRWIMKNKLIRFYKVYQMSTSPLLTKLRVGISHHLLLTFMKGCLIKKQNCSPLLTLHSLSPPISSPTHLVTPTITTITGIVSTTTKTAPGNITTPTTKIPPKIGARHPTRLIKSSHVHTLGIVSFVMFKGTPQKDAHNFKATCLVPCLNIKRLSLHGSQEPILPLDHHIIPTDGYLTVAPYSGGDDVLIGDGSGLPITHTGSSTLPSSTRPLDLHNILCVPNIHKNLISVYRLCNTNQVLVELFPASFQVKDLSTGVPLLQGKTKDDLYEWPVSTSQVAALYAAPNPKTTLSSWHARLGQPSSSVLNTIISKFSLPISLSSSKHLSCSDCLLNKMHKLPFVISSIVSTKPLQYLFSDVWTSPIVSTDNYKYYLILVDHYTRYTWFYPLKRKSDVRDTFIAFKALVENHFVTSIQTLYSDNGGEYVALRGYLASQGITHYTSPPHTPEHNGVSEHKHRHIVET